MTTCIRLGLRVGIDVGVKLIQTLGELGEGRRVIGVEAGVSQEA